MRRRRCRRTGKLKRPRLQVVQGQKCVYNSSLSSGDYHGRGIMTRTISQPHLSTLLEVRKFTYRELLEMERIGIIQKDQHVELLGGQIVVMTIPPPHAATVSHLDILLDLIMTICHPLCLVCPGATPRLVSTLSRHSTRLPRRRCHPGHSAAYIDT
jgi:hypothetical protein